MDEPISAVDEVEEGPGLAGRIASGVVAAVACLGLLIWGVIAIREDGPTRSWVRGLRTVDVRLAIPALIRANADVDPEVRAEAISSLGQLAAGAIHREAKGDRDAAVQALLGAMSDREGRVREVALATLGLYFQSAQLAGEAAPGSPTAGDRRGYVARVVPLLEDPASEVRFAAGSCLGCLPNDLDPAIPALVAAAAREATLRPGIRRGAAVALRRARPTRAAVPGLVEALRSPDPKARFFAASTLGRVARGATEAVPALVAMLRESPPSGEVLEDPGRAAASSLGLIAPGTPAAATAIAALRAARAPDDPTRDRAVIEALAQFEPGARPPAPEPWPAPGRPGSPKERIRRGRDPFN